MASSVMLSWVTRKVSIGRDCSYLAVSSGGTGGPGVGKLTNASWHLLTLCPSVPSRGTSCTSAPPTPAHAPHEAARLLRTC